MIIKDCMNAWHDPKRNSVLLLKKMCGSCVVAAVCLWTRNDSLDSY